MHPIQSTSQPIESNQQTTRIQPTNQSKSIDQLIEIDYCTQSSNQSLHQSINRSTDTPITTTQPANQQIRSNHSTHQSTTSQPSANHRGQTTRQQLTPGTQSQGHRTERSSCRTTIKPLRFAKQASKPRKAVSTPGRRCCRTQ